MQALTLHYVYMLQYIHSIVVLHCGHSHKLNCEPSCSLNICYFLQAANHGLVYPDYAWIIFPYESYPKKETHEDHAVCTDEDIILFLNMSRVIMMSVVPQPDNDSVQTDTGFVSLSLVLEISSMSLKLLNEDSLTYSTKS